MLRPRLRIFGIAARQGIVRAGGECLMSSRLRGLVAMDRSCCCWPSRRAGAEQGADRASARGAGEESSLLSFNDANVTGNYTVFHAKLSKPFRQQFTPERLKETFKSFAEKQIDFDIIAAMTADL